MAKQTAITDSNFRKVLSDWTKGAKAKRDRLQDLIMYGFQHYAESGNSNPLTDILHAVSETGFSVRQVQTYIQDHTGLNYSKKKETFKTPKDTEVGYTEPAEPWYSYKKESTNATAELDVGKKLKDLAKQVRNAEEKGDKEVKADDVAEGMAELRQALEEIRAAESGNDENAA